MIDITLQNFEAELITASQQRPVLLDIWAPWCGPCRTLGPLLEKLETTYAGRFTLAKLNSDEVPEIASQLSQMFGVRSIPFCVMFVDGQPVGRLTRDSILDNITLYWLTGTGASAARWYWEFGRFLAAFGGQAPPPVRVPVGFTTFPGELWAAPRSWVEAVYPGLAYFNAVDRGGHFAAWEEPALFATELRAAFKPLR